jgi:hypothetical protein
MSVQLTREDFNKLVAILRTSPGFATVRDRRRLVEAALEGVPRGADLLALLDLDGAPQLVAVEVVKRLAEFGQVAGGKEALGVFLNALLPLMGEDKDAAFIRALFATYPLDGPTGSRTAPTESSTPPATIHIFVSYSHQDDGYLRDDSLLGFLRGLEKEGIAFWTDKQIRPGEQWDTVIKDHLQNAGIALVLVSQAFLDSDYCQNVEIERFLAQKTHLIPIILSPCEWRRHRWLSERQFLPGGNETLEEHYTDTGRRKALFLKIREALRERAELIRQG